MSQMKGFGLRTLDQNSGSFENGISAINTHNHWPYEKSRPHNLLELIGIDPTFQAEED